MSPLCSQTGRWGKGQQRREMTAHRRLRARGSSSTRNTPMRSAVSDRFKASRRRSRARAPSVRQSSELQQRIRMAFASRCTARNCIGKPALDQTSSLGGDDVAQQLCALPHIVLSSFESREFDTISHRDLNELSAIVTAGRRSQEAAFRNDEMKEVTNRCAYALCRREDIMSHCTSGSRIIYCRSTLYEV